MKGVTTVASLAVLLIASPGTAQEPARPPDHRGQRPGGGQSGWEGVRARLGAVSEARWKETADHALIRTQETGWNRYLMSAMDLPTWLDLGLENRTRFEVYDHPWRTTQRAGKTDPQIQQRSRVRFGLNGGPVRLLFEGQDSRPHLDDPGDFVDASVENRTDILQLFVSATATDFLGTRLRGDLHLGRLTMNMAGRRLVARNDFRNTTNAFDGLHVRLMGEGAWALRAFLAEPVLIDDVRLDEQSARTVFWGIQGEGRQGERSSITLAYFGLNDGGGPSVAEHRTFSTFSLRVAADPKDGRIDYDLESVWQTGTRGGIDHFAYFGHLDLGYSFDLPWSPRFLIHYDYASGTRTPNGSQDETFDTLFGARRFEYMPTGNFGPFFRSNLSSPGWRVIATPARGWVVQVKHRVWYLAQARDAFAGSGLRDPTGGSGNYLGQDVELRVEWMISGNLELDAGYDHWFKGSYFDRLPAAAGLPPGGEKDTDYFYVSTQVRF